MQKDLIAPTVHLNGTSKNGLLRPIDEAVTAIDRAYAALKNMSPNARDYYVQKDPAAFSKAIAQHEDRQTRLDAIREELCQLTGMIDAQGRNPNPPMLGE